jgi:hypothetical protein
MGNVERGLRRITLVVSLGVFLVTLGLVGNEIHHIMNHRDRMRLVRISQQQAEECAQFQRRATAAQQEPADFDPSLYQTCQERRLWWSSLPPPALAPGYWDWNLVLVGAIGMVVSAAVGWIPWGIFYLTRWIVRRRQRITFSTPPLGEAFHGGGVRRARCIRYFLTAP